MGTLWAVSTPHDSANYNIVLRRDTMAGQTETKRLFDGRGSPLKYMVLWSRFPGVFNLGGDLEMFAECIERRERAKLLQYSHLCVEIVDKVWHFNDMNISNIGLAQARKSAV